jgi:hypothetical protein
MPKTSNRQKKFATALRGGDTLLGLREDAMLPKRVQDGHEPRVARVARAFASLAAAVCSSDCERRIMNKLHVNYPRRCAAFYIVLMWSVITTA